MNGPRAGMRTLLWAALMLAALPLIRCGTGPEAPAAGPGAEIGLELLGIELMAGGDLARLNYRVIDLEKAGPALRGTLTLIPSEGGQELAVAAAGRLGALRQRPGPSGRRQFMMFTNTGRVLRSGTRATLVVGATRLEGIPVL